MPESSTRASSAITDVLDMPREAPSAIAVVNILLKSRRAIVRAALLGGALATLVTVVPARRWSSDSTFMSQGRRVAGNISGLAAQFGLSVPGAEATQSPAFYADLATSRELLGAVVDSRYRYAADTGQVEGTLVELYDVSGRSPALKREAALRLLQKRVSASPNAKTGVVRLSVQAEHPELARQINARMLGLLDEFNRERRQSQASAERKFSESRLADARQQLREAEGGLQAFLQRNREYRNSPELSFQQERLSREVQMRQQIYTTLAQSFEQAKLEEVRDTPVLTLLETPTLAVKPQPRGLLVRLVAGLFVGAVLAGAWSILSFGMRKQRSAGTADMAEFDALVEALGTDLSRMLPWRRRVAAPPDA
jgi:uncharacterized protein involved in exopolysaccharide biosynthesis